MRFMMIIKANDDSEAGVLPEPGVFEAMGRYNEEMVKAGVMLAGEGLHPSSKGARVEFSQGDVTVTDGPFAETKDLVAGWMVIDVESYERAVELAGELSAAPGPDGEPIYEWVELRPFLSIPQTVIE
jgi:hypothetical protein